MNIEDLLKDGWTKISDSPIVLYEKELQNNNPLNKSDETSLRLVVHRAFNATSIGIMLPDGGIINLNISSLKDLKQIEGMIGFYDSPY